MVCRLQLLELGTSLGLATGMQLAGDATRQRQPRRKRPEASRLAGLLSPVEAPPAGAAGEWPACLAVGLTSRLCTSPGSEEPAHSSWVLARSRHCSGQEVCGQGRECGHALPCQ